MNVDSAAVFLAGTILYSLGSIVILVSVVVANNILHKYWKSFGWKWFPTWIHENPEYPRFATTDEMNRITPHLEAEDGKKETGKKV